MSDTTLSAPLYEDFCRRRIGRASSPPTWACYEQIPYDEDDCSDSASDDNSCSEDEEDYARAVPGSDSDAEHPGAQESSKQEPHVEGDMEIDEGDEAISAQKVAECKKDVKGKQRAIEPEHESPKKQQHRKKHRQPVFTLRPILTIQRSQGFVWNQVRRRELFLPADTGAERLRLRICSSHRTSRTDVRLLCSILIRPAHTLFLLPFLAPDLSVVLIADFASTSPPNASGFVSSSVSSTNSSMMDYEVEVVEIRVGEGELDDIIP